MQVNNWIVELAARAMFANRDEYDDRNLNAHPAFEHDREYWEGQARAALTAALGAMWRPISEAPKDGRMALVFRPLAHITHDQPVEIKRLVDRNNFCWPATVPAGSAPCNPTDGLCHVTHFMLLPSRPADTKCARSSAGSEQPTSNRQAAGSSPAERATPLPPAQEG